ncbi:MAG: hypothetical protein JNL92_08710 [Opitutaceae bacterium]|nr:hypothetical protein [Opitutaceae bacterium]
MKISLIRSLAALALSAVNAAAVEPFVVTATTTDNLPPVTLSSASPNFFDFISSIVNTRGAFQTLTNRSYNGTMTFLGVRDAIQVSANAPGTAVNIALAPIGFNRTFTGPSKDAVDDQIERFFKTEGAGTIADFLKAVAERSPIAVTDGNPNAATAVEAATSFFGQGFTTLDELGAGLDAAAGAAQPRFGGISLGLNTGKFEAGAFEGTLFEFSGTLLNVGGDTVRLVVPVHANYLELDGGSKVGGAGFSLTLPVRFQKMGKDNPINWRVTPLFGLSVRGSADLASLSPLWTAGVVNTIDYRLAPKWVVSLVNQLTVHKSFSVSYDDLEFDPEVDQQILKNGIRVTTPLARRVIADGFVIDTRFLKDAAVEQFWTIGGSLAFRVAQRWNLVLGVNYDTGDDFKAFGVGITSAWRW